MEERIRKLPGLSSLRYSKIPSSSILVLTLWKSYLLSFIVTKQYLADETMVTKLHLAIFECLKCFESRVFVNLD